MSNPWVELVQLTKSLKEAEQHHVEAIAKVADLREQVRKLSNDVVSRTPYELGQTPFETIAGQTYYLRIAGELYKFTYPGSYAGWVLERIEPVEVS